MSSSATTRFIASMIFTTSAAVACSAGGNFASSGSGAGKAPRDKNHSKPIISASKQTQDKPSAHSTKKSPSDKAEPDFDQEDDLDEPDTSDADALADTDADTAAKQQVIADITASLEQLRWELPCNTPPLPRLCKGTSTVADQKILSGESGTLFDIRLRFRGLVEPKTYRGGQHNGGFWQIGGSPTSDGWNVYKLEISNPPQVYYLNRYDDHPIQTFRIDYEADVQAYGGASFSITADTRDGLQSGNYDNIVFPEFSPTPFNGQFIQVTVSEIKVNNQ